MLGAGSVGVGKQRIHVASDTQFTPTHAGSNLCVDSSSMVLYSILPRRGSLPLSGRFESFVLTSTGYYITNKCGYRSNLTKKEKDLEYCRKDVCGIKTLLTI